MLCDRGESRRVLAVLIKFHSELHDRTELAGRADKNESRRSIDSSSNDRIASFSFARVETRFSKDSGWLHVREILVST